MQQISRIHTTRKRWAALALAGAVALPAAAEDWPQWGGPRRDFHAAPQKLAETWPEGGPQVLWRRQLGDGYSAVSGVGERLYTLYRAGDEEIVVALAAADGRTVWEHRYAAAHLEGMRMGYGAGPHATPLVAGGRVFATGVTAKLTAVDAGSGKRLWGHDLWQDFGGNVTKRGYACSPIAWGESVIVTVGGPGHGVMAFDQASGAVVWKRHDFSSSQSSPILIELGGQEQLVAFVADEAVGLDPASGDLLWRHPHPTTAVYNIATPIWSPEVQTLFLTSAYGGGSRALHLSRGEGGATGVEELWYSPKMKVHFSNALRFGDHVYGSSGTSGSSFLSAIDLATGEIAWKERRLRRVNLVRVGDTAIAIEEEGRLALVGLAPEGLTIHAEAQVVEDTSRAWTVPTVIGRRLYVRVEEILLAFELPVADTDEQESTTHNEAGG